MNITRKPQIKKKSVLNTNPTSAETVVSALPTLVRPKRKTRPNENVDIIFVIFIIRPPYKSSLIFKEILKTIAD